MRKIVVIILIVTLLFTARLYSQTTWSIATDFNAIRSFKTNQQFWGIGHTLRGEAHLTKRDGAYAWVSYFFRAKFNNDLFAQAKSSSTLPQTISFRNKANMSIKQFSIGWKHYFKGACDIEKSWNLYGMVGFGVIGGKVKNTFQTTIDTVLYNTPILSGESRFKRLTIDLAGGWETPISGDIIFYNEVKVWIPTSDYPSKYLVANGYAPLIASFHIGVRIYFE